MLTPRHRAGNRRRRLARRQRLPQQSLRRAADRRPHGDESAGAGAGRQLRRVGRPVRHVRLRREGRAQKGGSLQRKYVALNESKVPRRRTNEDAVIAGFLTGGSLAIRGGWKAARSSAIVCGCLLAVIEGVGIGFQRMMADNTKLEVRRSTPLLPTITEFLPLGSAASTKLRESPGRHGGLGVAYGAHTTNSTTLWQSVLYNLPSGMAQSAAGDSTWCIGEGRSHRPALQDVEMNQKVLSLNWRLAEHSEDHIDCIYT